MPIQFQNSADLLSAVIMLCFSFCISVMAFWFRNAEAMPRLLSISFGSVFLFSLSAILASKAPLSYAFLQAAEPLLLLLFLLLFAFKPDKKRFSLFVFLLVSLPVALFMVLLFSQPLRNILMQQLYTLSASAMTAAAVLYLLKDEREELNLLFWAVLPLSAAGFAQYYLTSGIFSFTAPILRLCAYSMLLVFFYRVFLQAQLQKFMAAEKSLTAINRSIDFEVKKRMMEIEKVNQRLLSISKTDAMSNVMNKSAVMDSIDGMINGKPNSVFSILMFDIDNFKAINDSLGHVVGDKCIKMLAATARSSIRDFDLIGRYGGDEFIIVLPGIEAKQALIVAERFRKRVEASDSPHYTVSIGIASYPEDGTDLKALIEAADAGLYRAKRRGRNNVSHRNFL